MKPPFLIAASAVAVAILATVPLYANGYQLSLAITLMNYIVLATA